MEPDAGIVGPLVATSICITTFPALSAAGLEAGEPKGTEHHSTQIPVSNTVLSTTQNCGSRENQLAMGLGQGPYIHRSTLSCRRERWVQPKDKGASQEELPLGKRNLTSDGL